MQPQGVYVNAINNIESVSNKSYLNAGITLITHCEENKLCVRVQALYYSSSR